MLGAPEVEVGAGGQDGAPLCSVGAGSDRCGKLDKALPLCCCEHTGRGGGVKAEMAVGGGGGGHACGKGVSVCVCVCQFANCPTSSGVFSTPSVLTAAVL